MKSKEERKKRRQARKAKLDALDLAVARRLKEVKDVCGTMACLQLRGAPHHVLLQRAQELLNNFLKLPPAQQDAGLVAAKKYIASGGDTSQFISIGGIGGEDKQRVQAQADFDGVQRETEEDEAGKG